jgi:hypothetical protein
VDAGSRTLQIWSFEHPAGVPPFPAWRRPYLDNGSLLKLRELPRKLVVIIGGGYIGLEMGQIAFPTPGQRCEHHQSGRG